ncbi:ead/Ea22-like family protein [Salmonella enterica subsp. diarizonae serovar 58:r:z53]
MNIDKQALRERYSPKPVPKCHICGEEMTIQRMSASRITYGCTGEGDDGYFKFGRTFVDEHYEESCITVVDVSDPDVLALLDELEATAHSAAVDHEAACSLVEENETLKRRIAEQQRSLDHRKFLLLSADEVQRDFAEALECAGDNESIMEAIDDLKQHIAELEAKLETADKLQDSAFRDGLKAGFSYGQTDDQSGFAQCMSAYSTRWHWREGGVR